MVRQFPVIRDTPLYCCVISVADTFVQGPLPCDRVHVRHGELIVSPTACETLTEPDGLPAQRSSTFEATCSVAATINATFRLTAGRMNLRINTAVVLGFT